jgi:hypothetical protein
MAHAYSSGMSADPEATYYIRGTNPTSNEVVIYECQGFAAAHAKAAELRMAAYKDVIMSVSNPDERSTRPLA